MSNQDKSLTRQLGLFSSVMILVGTVIGSGIFMTPGTVARAAGSFGPNILAWVIAGVAAIFLALVYAELAPMMPSAGGAYIYIRESFGDASAFIYGWSMIFGSFLPVIALLATAFVTYLSYFFPEMSQVTGRIISTALIIVLVGINIKGVKLGAVIQNIFTVGKLLALLLVIIGGLIAFKVENFSTATAQVVEWGNTFKAAVPAVLAFGGYYTLAYMSEEIENPKRNLPLAMIIGMGIVIIINILLNIACIGSLPYGTLSQSAKPVAEAALAIFGPIGGAIVAIGALVSIFGSLNSSLMGLPRVAFAMARENLLFKSFSKIHPKYGTPYISILIYGLVAIFFVWTGTFMSLLLMGVFVSRSLECVVAATLIVLRKKKPDAERPLKMWGYPITTLLAIIITGYLVTLVDPMQIRNGALLMLSSIPAYFIFVNMAKNKKKSGTVEEQKEG